MNVSSKTGITRRFLLGSLAATAVVTRLGHGVARAGSRPRIAVVGAGAFGGWTALQLARRGAEVVLVDAWGPGNPRASSGGESRVIRAVYGRDRIYSEWVVRAFPQWRELARLAGGQLYRETGSLWMFRGDDGYLRDALPILAALGLPMESLPPAEAARRWPQVDFAGIERVWLEPRSGVLAAREACRAVRDLFLAEGGTYRTARAEPGEIAGGRLGSLRLADGSALGADHYVFACGPWLGRLFPEVVGDGVLPTRQEVFYFGTPAGSVDYAPERLPVWIDFGERVIYGVPDVHGRGFKLADDTRGEPFDPTGGDRTPSAAGLAAARRFLAERFPGLAGAPLVEARVCQYENSPDGHLIVDRHPGAANLWLLGGGSGHGFKLAPALGEHAADRILDGAPGEPLFALARLGAAGVAKTQFERQGGGL